MPKVIFDIGMSLDGFITAPNIRPEEPTGDGGQRLHEWASAAGGHDRQGPRPGPSMPQEGSSRVSVPTTLRWRGGERMGLPSDRATRQRRPRPAGRRLRVNSHAGSVPVKKTRCPW